MAETRDPGPWYRDGIRFECQQTGACCTNHGDHAYVYVTAEEEDRLAAHLGLGRTEFQSRFTRREGEDRVLRNSGKACVFLEERRCSVYAARPRQCRTWPFWKENLAPGVWKREVVPLCAGVGRGRLYTRAEIEKLAAERDDDVDPST